MANTRELPVEKLYNHCNPEQFEFETTDDVEQIREVIGQPRAQAAMQFGIGMKRNGYNIFALGSTGTGKLAFIRQSFEQQAQNEPVPPDWCYVNNFAEPHRPYALRMPTGRGAEFRDDMKRLVEEIKRTLSTAFESEEYQTRQQVAAEEVEERQSEAFEELQRQAREEGLALIRTPSGFVFAPMRDGEVMPPEELGRLSEEERNQLQERVERLQGTLQRILRQVPSWQRERWERLNELNREMAGVAVGSLLDDLKAKYVDLEEVIEYLNAVQKDVVEHAQDFVATEQQAPQNLIQAMMGGAQQAQGQPTSLRRYEVNLLVDNSESKGAPVIYEDNPTYQNLSGRIEHMAQLGALLTDFNLIKAGTLHRANGGYLILDARKVLLEPYAWEGLKRALRSGKLRVESLGQMLSVISTVSLEPEAIPLDVKVALFGDRQLYYLLYQLDPDFPELFKVAADFEEEINRDPASQHLYAQLVAGLVRQEELKPFDRTAVARVIEHGSRMVHDAGKLSIQIRPLTDLLRESDYWAQERGNGHVMAADVQRAIDAQVYRSDRLRERMQEEIERETVLIDTQGEQVGQINGLSVITLGDFWFGRPTRITAQVRLGMGDVIDIEREVKLGGPIHSKGVLILSGFLGGRYAEESPLSLSASLVFEQSYGGVEGDSASSAELYALLSAIAQVPIKQSLAVTGSVNQHGQVQAIGGVNVKVEGFFDICKSRGLTGDQGVLVPASNVKHLMLREDVRQAVEAGQFHIYSVEHIDQGIEILTGIPAGEPDKEGRYPEGTINYRVEARLKELASKRQEFSAKEKEKEGES